MRRILALDGGGIRGVYTLQILAEIEAIFRRERNEPGLVLRDVFDMFAGTSTGSILATFLAWGLPVREIERLYIDCSPMMFAAGSWHERWKFKYKPEAIAEFFREQFVDPDTGGPTLLGTNHLKDKLLLVVMRNGSTGGSWPVTNNPSALYNRPDHPDCNLHFPIWQLLRASTAAPTYFPPEEIKIGNKTHLFMDGGMTPYNNPAFIAALMATLPSYHIGWPAAREKLHIISVGTGLVRARITAKAASAVNILDYARYVAPALLGSIAWQQDLACRVIGDCVHGYALDAEIGALETPTLFTAGEQKFTYARYDQPFDDRDPKIAALSHDLFELDNLKIIPLLQEIGREYAAAHVRKEHLYPREKGFEPCACSVTASIKR